MKGKSRNRAIGRQEGAVKIYQDYFFSESVLNPVTEKKDPVFSELTFERRLRMPRSVYRKTRAGVLEGF